MHDLIKKLAIWVLGDYSIYHIYSQSAENSQVTLPQSTGLSYALVDEAQVASSHDKLILDQIIYHGPDTHVYACLDGSRIVGLCYFWHGERYRKRNFWPLAEGEAKLVQIVTIPEMRGFGVASHLLAYAARDMFRIGFHCVYARIWHSNTPSLRAFQRAGWGRVATVIEVNPLRRKTPLRITWRKRGHGKGGRSSIAVMLF